MGLDESQVAIREDVYYNCGDLYKQTIIKETVDNNSSLEATNGDIYSEYFEEKFEDLIDNELPWFSVKTNLKTNQKRIKKYYITQQGCDALDVNYIDGYDISSLDICEDIDLILSISYKSASDTYISCLPFNFIVLLGLNTLKNDVSFIPKILFF